MAWVLSGVAISARYFLMNLFHSAGVSAERASFMVGRLGARLGNQTSYQFWDANLDLGTPRGGRRTVPMRKPSSFALGVPSLTMRMAMVNSLLAKVDDDEPHYGSEDNRSRQGTADFVDDQMGWSFLPSLASLGAVR